MLVLAVVVHMLKYAPMGVSHPDNQETVTQLVRHIQDIYQAHHVPIQASEARFYATYFLLRTLFRQNLCG